VKEAPTKEERGKEEKGNPDRVKVAKKIAKDMEKWAKTLNQKKRDHEVFIKSRGFILSL